MIGSWRWPASSPSYRHDPIKEPPFSCDHQGLDKLTAEMSPTPKESEPEGSFKPAKETKKIPLDPEHPERYAVVGTGLDSK